MNEEEDKKIEIPDTPVEVFVEEEPKKNKGFGKPRSTTEAVTMFRQIRNYCLVTDSKGKGYMVPEALCNEQKGLTLEVDLASDGIIPLYNWDKEIESMLPDRETLVQNIRLALWTNGAVSREAAKENKVQQNLMRGAFPYRIEIRDEE